VSFVEKPVAALPICEHFALATGRNTFKKLFVYGDYFLHERGGQQYSCWVACWRKRNVQRFDGML